MLHSFEGGDLLRGTYVSKCDINYTPKPNVVYIPAIKGETRNYISPGLRFQN